jgi:iron complex transport system ATP-binding protein
MSDVLVVRELSGGYDPDSPILRDVTLPPLEPGVVCTLVGPNGAGKSTLLRALAGLLPCKGTARLGPVDLVPMAARERSRFVAFMPQALPARIGFTVIESLMAALAVAPGGAVSPEAGVRLLDRLGILSLAHRPLDRLSGGQAQLASLALALMREPRLLLLDEPTSALDLRFQLGVMELVSELAAERRMIVIAILHDLGLAARWADTMAVLKDGRIVTAAPPDRAVTPGLLRDVYGVDALVDRDPTGHVRITVRGRADPASSLSTALENRP